jgi:hypothetical protein
VRANYLTPGRPSNRVGRRPSSPKGRALLGRADRQAAFLGKQMSPAGRVLGWLVATGLFLACVSIWYSPNVPDSPENIVPTVAIEHGTLRCAYPAYLQSSVPPLYPLVAAGVMEVTRLGTSDVRSLLYFDGQCDPSHSGLVNRHFSVQPFLLIGLLGWPILLGGFVALLSAAGRSRRRWEFLGACLIACTPAVADTLVEYFHPEDLFAMGLILAALAAAVRNRWLLSGVCIGLACCTKQYSLLVLVPLLVATPRDHRRRFLLAVVSVGALVLVPFGILIGRGALDAAAGIHATPAGNDTVVAHLHLQGVALVAASRALPLGLAVAIAVWAQSRLGSALCRAQPLVALVAACLALRLVFEVNLFGYYFMAMAVTLIALDIVVGRLRVATIGWILVTVAFFPPRFEQLVYVGERHWLIVQPVLALSGFALAALPLYQLCVSGSPLAESLHPSPSPNATVSSP